MRPLTPQTQAASLFRGQALILEKTLETNKVRGACLCLSGWTQESEMENSSFLSHNHTADL